MFLLSHFLNIYFNKISEKYSVKIKKMNL